MHFPSDSIILKAEHPGQAVLDGTGTNGQDALIEIRGKSYLTIQGFEIRNNIRNDAIGILIEGSGTNIRIAQCHIHDIHFSDDPQATVTEQTNAQGIIVYGTESTPYAGIYIVDNELDHCRLGYSEGIALNGNVMDFVINGNHIHDLTNIGIDIIGFEQTCPDPSLDMARNGIISDNTVVNCVADYDTSVGIYIDGGQQVTIFRNLVKGNGYGIETGCENTGHATENIEVRNNLIMENLESGLALGGFDYPSGSGKVMNTNILNNTFVNNDTQNIGTGSLYLSYCENCRIENNVFYLDKDDLLYAENSQPQLVMDYNIYWDTDNDDTDNGIDFNGTFYDGFNDFRSNTSFEAHGQYHRPGLHFDANGIPRLQSTSVLIDAGTPGYMPLSDETDFFGRQRVFNSRVDIGMEEFQGQNHIDESPMKQLICYPNPAKNFVWPANINEGFYTISSPAGQAVATGNFDRYIPLTKLAPGIYILQIVRNGKIFVGKVVKSK